MCKNPCPVTQGGMWILQCEKRICEYCSEETDEEYSDEEWDDRGHQCEQCETGELIVLDIM
jgi:hypothetical protein